MFVFLFLRVIYDVLNSGKVFVRLSGVMLSVGLALVIHPQIAVGVPRLLKAGIIYFQSNPRCGEKLHPG